jgi:hypothetical protein
MNRFYDRIKINTYDGSVFAGVSFRDQKGLAVKITKQRYTKGGQRISSSTELVCGRETDASSEWMPIGGPIKGFYIVKNGED